ncbi:MAG: sodium:solute symporter family protein [Desulfurispora sp.]|uniref:sodium:solute symporter family protein n=1 Tax=Desulfurispora sp. TaxID=3014275 RepID=UPI00404A19A3
MSASMSAVLALYLVITAGLGYLGYRQTRNSRDYLLAGGQTHPLIMALAYGATFISTSAIVGFGGAAAMYGMSLLWLTFLNIFAGVIIAFLIYGKRTLQLGKEMNVQTFPEFLGQRYGSGFIRRFAALVIALGMPLYTAAVLIGGARFIEKTLNMPYATALGIFALVVAAYVYSGGLKGVIYNDAFQALLMFVGMVLLLGLSLQQLGGFGEALRGLASLSSLVPGVWQAKGHTGFASMPVMGSEYWWVVVSTLVLGVGIGVLAQPQLAVRFLTVRSARDLNRGLAAGGVFLLAMTGVAFTVGALSNVYFYQHFGKIAVAMVVDPATGKPNIDSIIPLFIKQAMPGWFGMLFMLTLLSAAMSTLSGQLHTLGSALSYDLARRSSLTASRLGSLVALLLAVWLALVLPVSIIAVATAIFFGICAATFLPAYTAALFWPRVSKRAALASMLAGFAGSVGWMLLVHAKEAAAVGLVQMVTGRPSLLGFPWTVIDPLVVALPLSTLVLVLVGLGEAAPVVPEQNNIGLEERG